MMRFLFVCTIIVIGSLLQIAVQSSLALPWSAVSLPLSILPAIVHFSMTRGSKHSLYFWYAGAGFLLEVNSPYPFGGFVLACLCTAFVAQWFFDVFITNVSFLSYLFLLLLCIATYYLIELLFLVVVGVLQTSSDIGYFLTNHGFVLLATIIFALISYGLAQVIGRGLMHTHA